MNRKQAENILDAYVDMEKVKNYDARDALREVIIDAMTETRYYPYVTTTPADIAYTTKDHQWPHTTTVSLNASER